MTCGTTSETWRRYGPPAFALAAILAVSALHLFGAERLYRAILSFWIIFYNSPPFADAYWIARALECERMGFETYLTNPCSSRFVYTPFWKLAAVLPVTEAWTIPLSIGFIAIFFIALFRLPAAPTARGGLLMAAAMIAPSTVMAIQYGNNEMVVFGLAAFGAVLLGGPWAQRRWSYAIFLLAFLLKYFPLALMASALRERIGRLAVLAGIGVGLVGVFVVAAGDQLPLSLANIYTMSPFSYVFGVKNLSYFLEVMGAVSASGAMLVRVALTLGLVAIAAALALDERLHAMLEDLPVRHRDFLAVGALLVVASYFATQNVAYRQIHMLLALPALLCLRTDPRCPGYLRFSPVLALLLMYSFPWRAHGQALFAEGSAAYQFVALFGFLLREIGWAVQIAALLALLFASFRPAPLFAGRPFVRATA